MAFNNIALILLDVPLPGTLGDFWFKFFQLLIDEKLERPSIPTRSAQQLCEELHRTSLLVASFCLHL